MSNKNTSLKLSYLVEKLGLKTVYVPGGGSENCDDIDIITSEVNRPGLALTGYFTDFEKVKGEYTYVTVKRELSESQTELSFF